VIKKDEKSKKGGRRQMNVTRPVVKTGTLKKDNFIKPRY